MISHYIAVGLGGAVGAVSRVLLAKILPTAVYGIPLKIFFINLLGCFVMGLLTEMMSLHWSASYNMKSFLVSGVLGGFTTFSAFSLEFGLLIEKNQYTLAVIYTTLSVALTLIAFLAGMKLVKFFS